MILNETTLPRFKQIRGIVARASSVGEEQHRAVIECLDFLDALIGAMHQEMAANALRQAAPAPAPEPVKDPDV